MRRKGVHNRKRQQSKSKRLAIHRSMNDLKQLGRQYNRSGIFDFRTISVPQIKADLAIVRANRLNHSSVLSDEEKFDRIEHLITGPEAD